MLLEMDSSERGAHAQGGEQGSEAGVVALAVGRDQGKLVLAHAGIFCGGIAQAELDDFLRVSLAAAETSLELGGGHVDVDVGVGAADGGIVAGADGSCTLHVDIHDHVLAGFEQLDDVALECAVAVAVHGGVLQELAGGYFGSKYLGGEEVVVHTILLARAGLAGGAGDGVGGETVLFSAAAECGLATAGGAGNDKKSTKHGE